MQPFRRLLLLLTSTGALAQPIASVEDAARAQSACSLLAQVRGLQAPVRSALLGDASAFTLAGARLEQLRRNPALLNSPVHADLVQRLSRHASLLIGQRDVVLNTRRDMHTLRQDATKRLEEAEAVSSDELKSDAPALRVAASGMLVMLTQRVGKSASELLMPGPLDPEAVFLLGKDAERFEEIARALRDGDASLGLKPTRSAQQRQRLTLLLQGAMQTRKAVDAMLARLSDWVLAIEAAHALGVDAEALGQRLEPACFR
jgi:Type IV pili methyl-accepting chemotaxis transducer N-term